MASELTLALYGAWRLARLDRSGLAFFDRSPEGFWRSFRAAGIVYPAFLVTLPIDVSDTVWQEAGAVRILAVATIGFVIMWTAFPLALLPILRRLGRESRFFDFMVAYNWAQILEIAVMLGVMGVSAGGLLPARAASALGGLATVAVLGYEWFIAQVALDLPPGPAAIVVFLAFILAEVVGIVMHVLYAHGIS